ncbi:type II toxin-antitoxin system VapC family toxin [Candidatus Bathyarchaeota archaeon]|nr:type II toxin-antitoxin system VapC family toxin [Candidatus Bathyarchaeota archaeon]
MSYLFDSSAIINLSSEKKGDKLLKGATLNLAFYEVGNAIWKQVYLRKSITKDEGSKALTTLTKVLKQMKEAPVKDEAAILNIAVIEELTYYDASYIQAAIDSNSTLVTDDGELLSKAKKYVETKESAEIG